MPSQRRRIGFLPSEEVHEIIDKLCSANEFSQSKVTGLLVEEALRSRGVLNSTFSSIKIDKQNFFKDYFEHELPSNDNKIQEKSDINKVNRNSISEEIKMIHEYIEFKYFKKIMKQNKKLYE